MTSQAVSKAVKAYLGRALRETGTVLQSNGGIEIFSRHRPSMTFQGRTPFKTNDTFIAPSATVIGNVTNWDQSTVWYKAVVRADSIEADAEITIGFCSCVGEGSVVTTLLDDQILSEDFEGISADCYIGHYVTVGAGCVLKSCRLDDLIVVGDKCTLLEGCWIEKNVFLEPGTTVLPYQRIPTGQKWGGNPAQFIADLTPEEKDSIQGVAVKQHLIAKEHALEFLPFGYSYVHLEELQKASVDV